VSSEVPPSRSGLSDEQINYLIATGEFTVEGLAETMAAIARGELAAEERATRDTAVEASLSTAEVASGLGLGDEEVESQRAQGALYAFATAEGPRYPTWQFTGDPQRPVLPGLDQLVDAFPADWHPAGVAAFMSTPQRSARIHDTSATPAEWLLHDGDPQVLRNILGSFLQS
jgi:hypothetical protein